MNAFGTPPRPVKADRTWPPKVAESSAPPVRLSDAQRAYLGRFERELEASLTAAVSTRLGG